MIHDEYYENSNGDIVFMPDADYTKVDTRMITREQIQALVTKMQKEGKLPCSRKT